MRAVVTTLMALAALGLTPPAEAAPPKKSAKQEQASAKKRGAKKPSAKKPSGKKPSAKKPSDDEPEAADPPEAIDDDVADDEEATSGRAPQAKELELSDAEIEKRIRKDLGSLGSMSVGHPNSGALFNPVHMPKSARWSLMEPGIAWGTQETVDYLTAAIDVVHRRHAGSHKLYIGHLSAKRGGHLSPHKSHQSGRDVDISYFYQTDKKLRWYERVNDKNLDRARTWTFVRALLTETDVQYIFINTSVQKLLKAHAAAIGEDGDWLDSVFQYGQKKGTMPIIRHAPGHDTHIHVRFYNPVAQELGRRAHALLVKHKLIKPPVRYIQHTAKKGEILGRLATRYKTTVAAIKRLNKIRGNTIFAGKTYLIPKVVTAGDVKRVARVVVPNRRLPPDGGGTGGKKTASAETK